MPHNRRMADDRPVSALRLLLTAAAMTVAMLLVAALGEWALVPSAGVRELDEGGVARAVGLLADVTWLESAGRLWSDLTRPWVVHTVVLLVVLVLLAGRRVPPRALLVVPVGLLGRALGVVCKELVERPRPAEGVIDYTSWSYPSGHATNIALGAVLLLALLRAVRTGWIRWSATIATLIVVTLTAADRLVLGVHHPSDVVMGLALGALMALVGLTLLRPLPPSFARP